MDPKGSPTSKNAGSIWALPKWGGSRPLPKWFGALILRRIVHVQRGICLVWGVWTLARMVWGTYAVKIEVQMAFAQVGPEIKCPRVPVWVKGRGCNRYLGNARIDLASNSMVLPLCHLSTFSQPPLVEETYISAVWCRISFQPFGSTPSAKSCF